MKLPQPLIRLPLRVDAARLRAEVASLPAGSWSGDERLAWLRLISRDGQASDARGGPQRPTAALKACPYLQQVLAGLGVAWSRTRLLRLAPGMALPEQADIDPQMFRRVRLTLVLHTHPHVRLSCGGQSTPLVAGEAWLLDTWRRHRLDNDGDAEHLQVEADTHGSAAFWAWARGAAAADRVLAYDAAREAELVTECQPLPAVLPPGEVDLLVEDLVSELVPAAGFNTTLVTPPLAGQLRGFALDWRQIWCVHGQSDAGLPHYRRLLQALRAALQAPEVQGLVMRGNRIDARSVIGARLLQHALADAAPALEAPRQPAAGRGAQPRFDRPLILLGAPRSGGAWLYEMLAATPQLANLGGEAHGLFESIAALRPGAPGVDSNRLDARQLLGEHVAPIHAAISAQLRDPRGTPWAREGAVRLLEKTSKHALCVPALEKLFADARYVLLWRDPRESLASIMEAWASRRFVTYPRLPGWKGPWSLLLPPGWQGLAGAPLAHIAAHQWLSANRTALADLAALPAARSLRIEYAALRADPAATLQRICRFAELDYDAALAARVADAARLSSSTLSPPLAEKWLAHEVEISPLLPQLAPLWTRLQASTG